MLRKMFVVLTITLVVGVAGLPADAQDSKDPKGVTVRNLVTSLGGFSATVNAPILITGGTVALEPGGQTGRQQFRVPTYIYVVEGILTTFYEAGPVGIQGAQYHADRRSEEHTSELQSRVDLVCRLLLEKKNRDSVRRLLERRQATDVVNLYQHSEGSTDRVDRLDERCDKYNVFGISSALN